MTEPSSVFTAALLYSPNESFDPQLSPLIKRIREDRVLSEGVHLVSVNSRYVRELLRNNESGVTVQKWPVFVVREPQLQSRPVIYPLTAAEEVFRMVRDKFPPTKTGVHREVSWDLRAFPSDGSGKEMIVNLGEILNFRSRDGITHDITLSNSSWKPLRRLAPRQTNLTYKLTVDGTIMKGGRCHLVSSPSDEVERMRLRLIILDPTDEIIDGLTDTNSDSSPRMTRFARPAEPEKSVPDQIKLDLATEGRSSGLRSNRILAKISAPHSTPLPTVRSTTAARTPPTQPATRSTPPTQPATRPTPPPAAKTTFAQRRAVKKLE